MTRLDCKEIIRDSLIHRCIKYLIIAYNEIISSGDLVGKKPLEDVRRNQIVKFMVDNKPKYKFKNTISTEAGTIDEQTYKTVGRIDICIFSVGYEQKYISFECKRFVKGDIGKKALEEAYYSEGLSRYEDGKYLCQLGCGGMIAFLEEGKVSTLNRNIQRLLAEHSIDNYTDESILYNHQYVYSNKIHAQGKNVIEMKNIIMSFV